MQRASFQGKGHERSDLARLMRIFGDWAHELYPRYTLKDFAAATERVASAKRMRVRGPPTRSCPRSAPPHTPLFD